MSHRNEFENKILKKINQLSSYSQGHDPTELEPSWVKNTRKYESMPISMTKTPRSKTRNTMEMCSISFISWKMLNVKNTKILGQCFSL